MFPPAPLTGEAYLAPGQPPTLTEARLAMPDSGTAGLCTIRLWCYHGDVQAPKGRMVVSPKMRLKPCTLHIK